MGAVPQGIRVRRAEASETQAVSAIVAAAYRHYIPRIGKPPGPMLDDYARRIADGEAWVLNDAGRLAGVLILEETEDGFLLDNIAVLPDSQGKGFGRILIEFAEAEALRRGWTEIRLYTHVRMTENIALYARIGFVETHRSTAHGYDRVYMTKRLA